MRIDRLRVENFKRFKEFSLELSPHFTLLVGDNGAGKTSVLDALAVALGLWHKAAPGSGWRNILPEEIRLEQMTAGDRTTFRPVTPSKVVASGSIGSKEGLSWTRMIRRRGTRTTNAEAVDALAAINALVEEATTQHAPLPVLAYYGAGRAWVPTNKRTQSALSQGKLRQFDAYRNCLDTRISDSDLNSWFLFETAAAASNGGFRPGFQAVKSAVMKCVPGADNLRYDVDQKEILLSIRKHEQPFHNLSAGQRVMLALVADVAIKAVTLNSYLLVSASAQTTDPSLVLTSSPGIVLIDELDVHLHPEWQRRVAADLKSIFPRIQFVCTSHSPQIIGELAREEIRVIEGDKAFVPARSFGIDSNRILTEVMAARIRNSKVQDQLTALFQAIHDEDFVQARSHLTQIEERLGEDDPEVTHARALMSFLQD